MEKAWHPDRLKAWLDAGFDPDDPGSEGLP
jgi:hypothetical protein